MPLSFTLKLAKRFRESCSYSLATIFGAISQETFAVRDSYDDVVQDLDVNHYTCQAQLLSQSMVLFRGRWIS